MGKRVAPASREYDYRLRYSLSLHSHVHRHILELFCLFYSRYQIQRLRRSEKLDETCALLVLQAG